MPGRDKKSYYAIIPADVRYDKSLPANAKLLYGEITALCNQEGFCWASNSYFASLYCKDVRTVKRWISQLIEQGYIRSEIDKKAGNKRRLYLVTKMPLPRDKNAPSSGQKLPEPGDKNATHNTKDNTTLKKITGNRGKASLENSLSSNQDKRKHYAITLLTRYGVDQEVARKIVYDQHVPLESIEEVIMNGLAKEQSGGGKFVLEAGYIVKALNQARHEGKVVGPTKASKKLSAKLAARKRKKPPMSPKEFQAKQSRDVAALREQ